MNARPIRAGEALEPRLVLTALLRPGAEPDSIVVAPDAAGGWEATAGAIPLTSVSFESPLSIDVSQDTPADQRYGFAPSEQGPRFQVATDVAYTLAAVGSFFISNFPTGSLGYRSYDADGLEILPVHVTKHGFATDTVLTAALRAGDSSFLVADASGWSNTVWEPAGTRGLAWYGYQNASGEVYADYTYTRNVATGGDEGLWQA
ncbi:MAG: hypothetical protein AAF266_16780, partial [Planctomycetota bacterium]